MDDTFLPALEKMFNTYSQQASEVMIHANRLLDKFYFMIWRGMNPEDTFNDTLGNNRFCRLTIWTSGNSKDMVDGFSNNIHVDNDNFHRVFQEAASWLLQRIETECTFCHKDIAYLNSLRKTSKDKFQSPTVCGYDIVRKQCTKSSLDDDSWEVYPYFTLLGLGISIKLCKCYHSFMAASVSHCTPTPISMVHDIVCTYTGGDINVVGWGGGGNEGRRRFYEQNGGIPVPRLTQRFFRTWLQTLPMNVQILARNDGLV